MEANNIRVITICVFRHGERILAAEGWDPTTQQLFYRPVGGGVEFGEHSREAIVREIREELGAEVERLRYLGTIENIFTYQEKLGHEIVIVYDGAFVDQSLYQPPWLDAIEDNGQPFKAVWKALRDFQPAQPPLYPLGLLELLT